MSQIVRIQIRIGIKTESLNRILSILSSVADAGFGAFLTPQSGLNGTNGNFGDFLKRANQDLWI